ncbi:DHA2 family efflux MFS transporter permease subunit [Sphingoaurantiacus capsulatus]|uniref:DHA2 family efflux MFS transporter permease subunit n=1 Tax=Sphingoaurantiacus capsulatus TaxID=1771310 RepID=A0ABV7X9I2_9SPHN
MAASAAATAPGVARSPNRVVITFSVMAATIMQVLDSTIANVALPHMQASLGAAQDTIVWVLTSYIVASAIAIPITGWLADRFGVKRLLLISIGGFVVTSMMCGAAQNLDQMVAFRVLQGVFGAFLVPLAQSVMLGIYPREKHGQAMALWGMGVMIGPIMGPMLGGWLTENFDWRWVFYINLPIGILAALGIWLCMDETPRGERRFDLFGFALLAMAVGALQLLLDRGESEDWFAALEIWIYAGLMVSGLWMLIVHTATSSRETVLPGALLRDRNVVTALVFSAGLGLVLFAGMALMPPMLQHLFGYPTITTGLVLAPRGVGTMLAMMVVGRIVGKVDPRLLIFLGFGLTSLSLYQMTGFSLEMDMTPVIVSGVIQGLGIGFIFVPLNTIAFATIAPNLRTDAASLLTLIRSLGSSIGISLVTVMLSHNLQTSHADLAAHLTPFNVPLADPALAARMASVGDTALVALDAEVNRQALMIAYLDDFQLMLILTLAIMPLVVLLRKPSHAPDPDAPPAHMD